MRRIALLALITWGIPWAAAWGQVAAPSLLPAKSGVVDPTASRDPGIVPTNPAVLGWPATSKAALGVVRSERDPGAFAYGGPPLAAGTTVNISSKAYFYDGTYGGAAYHNPRYTAALEAIALHDSAGADTLNFDNESLGVAAPLGENLVLGAGYQHENNKNGSSHSRSNGWSTGMAIRIGDVFYVGAVAGQDNSNSHDTSSNGSDISGQRTSYGAGIGFLGGSSVQMHFELWAAKLGELKDTSTGASSGPGTVSTAIAEVRAGVAVLGYTGQTSEAKFASDTADASQNGISHEVTVGVVSDHGFSVLYGYGLSTSNLKYHFITNDSTSHITTNSKSQSLTLAWQY